MFFFPQDYACDIQHNPFLVLAQFVFFIVPCSVILAYVLKITMLIMYNMNRLVRFYFCLLTSLILGRHEMFFYLHS